ncbi:effector-associated constant component EACC1 [Actinokineospora sp. HUAS TT18]|uniref:effector-associated constant component EACC1 n=1 Tax=Actinokineospora sp. HUAS TT18 TaxID=3447451 RepID=UPI003F5208A8
MHVAVSVAESAELESLYDWLSGDADLQVAMRVHEPKPGELGAVSDALMVAVGSGGAITVLAASLRAWIQRPRHAQIKITVINGERTAEIDADRVKPGEIEAILKRLIED